MNTTFSRVRLDPLAALLILLPSLLSLMLALSSTALAEEVEMAWALGDPVTTTAKGPRVLVYHDMEGLSGQTNPDSYFFSKPEYAGGQEMLAADINAVVAGLFDGGASEVHIVDGHGSGNPDPDLRTDLLDPRASQVFRSEPFDAYSDLGEPGAYDAIAVVGMHAKTGSGGFASHTINPGIGISFNHQSITETELIGLSWGRYETPVIFASGDDRLAADLENTMPWIKYVTVKTAVGAGNAEPRPVQEARAELQSSARQALENIARSRVMKMKSPVVATVHAVPPASLKPMSGVPGIDYENGSVSFEAADFETAYSGAKGIIAVANTAYAGSGMAAMAQDGGPSVGERFFDALIKIWIDQESAVPTARTETAVATPTDPPEKRRYHGYQ
jgi:D-amino peptidase